MQFVSTRGGSDPVSFFDAFANGLAPDGGLYVPKEWPKFSKNEIESMRELSYADLSIQVMKVFIGNSISSDDFDALWSIDVIA